MYDYKNEKLKLFTSEKNTLILLKVMKEIQRLIKVSGAVKLDNIIGGDTCSMVEVLGGFVKPETFTRIACVEWLKEVGEIKEITNPKKVLLGNRVFVSS